MRSTAARVDPLLRVGELPCSAMDVCAVCGGALPPVSIRNRDPFCSRVCAQTHHGTGDPAERARAARAQLEKAIEDGTDATSLELRRVTVDERSKLIAEGRYGEEFLRAFQAYLIAHKSPVTEATVTWFSYRSSGPTMRRHEEPDEDDPWYQRDSSQPRRNISSGS